MMSTMMASPQHRLSHDGHVHAWVNDLPSVGENPALMLPTNSLILSHDVRVWLRGWLDYLDADDVDLDAPPARPRSPSTAQTFTLSQLADRGLSERRLAALRAIDQNQPVTCDRLEQEYGWRHQSLSAALNWLERQSLVERDQTQLVRTRSGHHANPYSTTPKGRFLLNRYED